MLGRVLNWLTSGAISAIGNQVLQYQRMKLQADSDEKKMEMDAHIALLEAQKQVLVAETGSSIAAITKSLLALPVAIYWWKLVVWDTVFQLGSTPFPGDHVVWFVTLVPPAYFLTFVKWR